MTGLYAREFPPKVHFTKPHVGFAKTIIGNVTWIWSLPWLTFCSTASSCYASSGFFFNFCTQPIHNKQSKINPATSQTPQQHQCNSNTINTNQWPNSKTGCQRTQNIRWTLILSRTRGISTACYTFWTLSSLMEEGMKGFFPTGTRYRHPKGVIRLGYNGFSLLAALRVAHFVVWLHLNGTCGRKLSSSDCTLVISRLRAHVFILSLLQSAGQKHELPSCYHVSVDSLQNKRCKGPK